MYLFTYTFPSSPKFNPGSLVLVNITSLVIRGFPGDLVKNLPAMQETLIPSLGWEEALEKRMATHSSTLAWRIPRTEQPGGPQPMGLQRVRHS